VCSAAPGESVDNDDWARQHQALTGPLPQDEQPYDKVPAHIGHGGRIRGGHNDSQGGWPQL